MNQQPLIQDPELAEVFSQAYGQYKKHTSASDYTPRQPRVPVPRKVFVPRPNDARKLTMREAFNWLNQADAYTQDRLQDKPIDARELRAMWEEFYSNRYAKRHREFPADSLAMFHLNRLQWHDVLNKVKDYVEQKEVYDPVTYRGDASEPFELIETMAAKMAKNKKTHAWRRKQAVAWLSKAGINIGDLNLEQRREVEKEAIAESEFPRTYL